MISMTNTQTFEKKSSPSTKNHPLLQAIINSKHCPNALLLHGPSLSIIESNTSKIIHAIHSKNLPLPLPTSNNIQEPSIDLIIINPIDNHIKIDTIKQLQHRIKFGASKMTQCIVIIHDINRLTTSACNALLKSIEEPKTDICFILTTQNKASIMPTIVSRSQSIHCPTTLHNIHQSSLINQTELMNQIHAISATEFCALTQLERIKYIQSLPSDTSVIKELFHHWQIEFTHQLSTLSPTEKNSCKKSSKLFQISSII